MRSWLKRGLLYSVVSFSRGCSSEEVVLVNINNNGTRGFSNFDNEFRVLRLLLMARWLEEYSITLKISNHEMKEEELIRKKEGRLSLKMRWY
jgi:hypothetical protein